MTTGCYDSGKASGWQVIGAWGNWAGSVGGAATMLAGPVMKGISALADVMGAEAATGEIVADAAEAVTNTNCFVAGTLVQMADGTTRAIEQIKDGDLVWSRDEKTGKLEAKRVVRTTHRVSSRVVLLTLTNPTTGKIVEQFTVSVEHPFYVVGKGWVGASHLDIGSQLATREGSRLTLSSLVVLERPQGWALYNLTVEKDHTYFVGKCVGGVWVHNTTPPHWKLPGTLIPHFGRHGADFGARTPEEYANMAHEFWQRSGQPGMRVKYDPVGDMFHVDEPSTGTYGAYNGDGTTATFYKPGRPNYWDDQPGEPVC